MAQLQMENSEVFFFFLGGGGGGGSYLLFNGVGGDFYFLHE